MLLIKKSSVKYKKLKQFNEEELKSIVEKEKRSITKIMLSLETFTRVHAENILGIPVYTGSGIHENEVAIVF